MKKAPLEGFLDGDANAGGERVDVRDVVAKSVVVHSAHTGSLKRISQHESFRIAGGPVAPIGIGAEAGHGIDLAIDPKENDRGAHHRGAAPVEMRVVVRTPLVRGFWFGVVDDGVLAIAPDHLKRPRTP